MRHNTSRLLLLLLGATLAFAACTPHRETVNRYKYLIKESDSENTATSTAPSNKEIIREKAPSLNIGEKLVPVLEEASEYLGTPYKHGGTTHSGIDCSGLTQNCYSKAGINLPRSAADQSQYGEKISRKNLQIGDLVFFDAKSSGKIDHVGMVTKVDGDKVVFIHSSTSKGVRFDMLNEGYWQDKLRESRRVPLQ
jgi:cell wall-associated NlpC family hydrolase